MRPSVALVGFGYFSTLASSSDTKAGAEVTAPHLHSPRSIQLSLRMPTTSICNSLLFQYSPTCVEAWAASFK